MKIRPVGAELFTFLIVRRIERDMMKNVYWSSSKVFDIPVRF